jgi:pimeloyl-ACP methyl ester carboxylesterase/predicted glycosyltransferase
MDAADPVEVGHVDRDGVRVAWELYGGGEAAVTFPPVFNIVHSGLWNAQVPWLARHFRVLTIDPRGNGRSDRPTDPSQFGPFDIAGDVVAALDAAGVERTVLVGGSMGSLYSVLAAAMQPERVAGIVHIDTGINLTGDYTDPMSRALRCFDEELDTDDGWALFNRHAFQRDWPKAAEFFMRQANTDTHSGRAREEGLEFALEADPASAVALVTELSRGYNDESLQTLRHLLSDLKCPQLVIHGTDDHVSPFSWGQALAETTDAPLHAVEGGGHGPHVRYPAMVNRMLHEFTSRAFDIVSTEPKRPTSRRSSPPRILYLSSPIGLGHVRRDLAIGREVRDIAPDITIDWLAQDPVERVLVQNGERIHPASRHLAGESAFVESLAGEHDLNVFEAFRGMDKILVNNFGVLNDLLEAEPYDMVIADEAWEADLFLHEHPELKRTRFTWLTDFVGSLPMPEGDGREEWFAADYNRWNIENVERHPEVRDLALFIGEPEDVVDRTFGPGLPRIDKWVADNYDFCGYVTGYDPAEVSDTASLREELGFGTDETVVVAAVGGTGVGQPLLRRIIEAHPMAARQIHGLRTVVVTGPRIDPDSLPDAPGVEKQAFVPDLHRHLAAADLGVVQGGLTITMELTATNRPFLYFPLQNHFEQQIHVRHRLERHRAGVAMDYETATPEAIADEMVKALDRETDYLGVRQDGARRAAIAISALL